MAVINKVAITGEIARTDRLSLVILLIIISNPHITYQLRYLFM
jgi:hypothetical protein